MPLTPAEVRKTFPATEDLVFLDAAAVSLISDPVHEAVGGLRVSTHFFNNLQDIETLLSALEELK